MLPVRSRPVKTRRFALLVLVVLATAVASMAGCRRKLGACSDEAVYREVISNISTPDVRVRSELISTADLEFKTLHRWKDVEKFFAVGRDEVESFRAAVLQSNLSMSRSWNLGSKKVEFIDRAEQGDQTAARLPPTWSFSPIGYGGGCSRALVFADMICGGLCGKGEFFLLVRDESGKWVIADRRTAYER